MLKKELVKKCHFEICIFGVKKYISAHTQITAFHPSVESINWCDLLALSQICSGFCHKVITMDAIRKKMKSLKDETEGLLAIIQKFEEQTAESNKILQQAECDIRDFGKKVNNLEITFEETVDKLNKSNEELEVKANKVIKECSSMLFNQALNDGVPNLITTAS